MPTTNYKKINEVTRWRSRSKKLWVEMMTLRRIFLDRNEIILMNFQTMMDFISRWWNRNSLVLPANKWHTFNQKKQCSIIFNIQQGRKKSNFRNVMLAMLYIITILLPIHIIGSDVVVYTRYTLYSFWILYFKKLRISSVPHTKL